VTKGAINAPDFVGVSRSCYAVFRHLDLGDSTKREEQLDQIFRRIFGSLAQDVADRGGYGCMEQYISGLQPGEIHAHCLSWLKGSHNLPLIKLWACCPPIANGHTVQRWFAVGQPLLAVPLRPGETVRDSQEWLSYCKPPRIVSSSGAG